MSTARVLKESSLNQTESLVLLSVADFDGSVKEYVTIVTHTATGKISFRSAELVTNVDKNRIFLQRAAFNGRSADVLVNQRKSVTLDPRKVILEKERSPLMNSK